MKLIFTLMFILFVFNVSLFSKENPNYDSTLAKRLNADDMGMKSYIFCILKTGDAKDVPKEVRDSLFKGHFSNMSILAESGKLVVAGPFGKNENSFRGLFIFNTSDIDEARSWVMTDPAVKGQLLTPELYPWYGSAALMEVSSIHNKIQKKGF